MFLSKTVLSSILLSLISLPAGVLAADIKLDTNVYTLHTQYVNGQQVTYRAYENLIYVAKPIDETYEKMNLYVPEVYYQGQSSNGYTAKTAPIFMPNQVGGYMPGKAAVPGIDSLNGGPNATLYALAQGYVVAAPALRGRTLQDAKGVYTGKAPACIVDYKAAVRYLRYNKNRLPAGDTEKIISNGTSAGGALSALLGATGDSKDYQSYLQALGAANVKDHIFASMAYCPITDLEHADMAYEWIFNGINTYHQQKMPGGLDVGLHGPFGAMQVGNIIIPLGPGPVQLPKKQNTKYEKEVTTNSRPTVAPFESGTVQQLTPQQITLSPKLKNAFPSYINSLSLKDAQGKLLTLDKDGNGSFKKYLESYYLASANSVLAKGQDLSTLDWLTIKNSRATDMDLSKYAGSVTRLKAVPAFDALELSSGENNLFGTATDNNRHFTSFSACYGTHGKLADPKLIQLMNPLNYIGNNHAVTAKYWRIRHGSKDRDTTLAIPLILATKLANNGAQVDFASAWEKGHAGDYDLPELFAWADKISHAK